MICLRKSFLPRSLCGGRISLVPEQFRPRPEESNAKCKHLAHSWDHKLPSRSALCIPFCIEWGALQQTCPTEVQIITFLLRLSTSLFCAESNPFHTPPFLCVWHHLIKTCWTCEPASAWLDRRASAWPHCRQWGHGETSAQVSKVSILQHQSLRIS